MYLARLTPGRDPIVTEVDDNEGYQCGGRIILRPRRPWARKTKDGAAALSQTEAGAIASAKVVLEQDLLRQRGADRPCKLNQRAYVA